MALTQQSYVLVAVTANGTLIRDGQFNEADGDHLVKMVPLAEIERLREAGIRVVMALLGVEHDVAAESFERRVRCLSAP